MAWFRGSLIAACVSLQDKAPHVLSPADDLRFYARGAFASPAVTLPDGAWRTWYGVVRPSLYGASLIVHSLLDYPVRNWSGRRWGNRMHRGPRVSERV